MYLLNDLAAACAAALLFLAILSVWVVRTEAESDTDRDTLLSSMVQGFEVGVVREALPGRIIVLPVLDFTMPREMTKTTSK